MSSGSSGPGPRGKVEQLIEEHDLDAFGDYMVEQWTAEDSGDRSSLRALARKFNIRVLKANLAAVGEDPIDGTAEMYYDSLTENDVSSGVRTQVRRTLEQADIELDELESEFVSRQAIHTYLTKTRGVSNSPSKKTVTRSSTRETINRLRERTKQVTVSKIEQLRNAEELSVGEFRVIVDIQVYCSDCRTQQSVSDLLTDGSCNCPG